MRRAPGTGQCDSKEPGLGRQPDTVIEDADPFDVRAVQGAGEGNLFD